MNIQSFSRRIENIRTKGGIRVHLILGLTVFVLLILAVIWVFQVLLLDFFYEKTKLSQLNDVISYIEKYIDSKDLDSVCGELASEYDVCISVYSAENGRLCDRIVNKEVSPTCVIHYADIHSLAAYYSEALDADGEYTHRYTLTPGDNFGKRDFKPNGRPNKDMLPGETLDGNNHSKLLVIAVAVKSITDSQGNEYAVFINLEFTPISTVQQTRNVQFGYIVVLIVILTIVFAWGFSNRISRPLEKMTTEAERMADIGHTAIFQEEGYRETQRLAHTLNFAVGEIAKTERLQHELIANVSHDLRTPLTLITGYAEMMRDLPGENSPENCQYIIDESKRLTTLVNDLLGFSKYSSGCQTPDFKVMNLTESVRATIDRYSELVRRYGYIIDFDAAENVDVLADEGMILQVIYNLLNNAINYTGEDKKVSIKQTLVSSNTVRISVTDTGDGISKDDIEKIWDRYYTEGKTHKRAIVGSGIGLSIVSKLLRLHSASYGVESAEGMGTTFWFELQVIHN